MPGSRHPRDVCACRLTGRRSPPGRCPGWPRRGGERVPRAGGIHREIASIACADDPDPMETARMDVPVPPPAPAPQPAAPPAYGAHAYGPPAPPAPGSPYGAPVAVQAAPPYIGGPAYGASTTTNGLAIASLVCALGAFLVGFLASIA